MTDSLLLLDKSLPGQDTLLSNDFYYHSDDDGLLKPDIDRLEAEIKALNHKIASKDMKIASLEKEYQIYRKDGVDISEYEERIRTLERKNAVLKEKHARDRRKSQHQSQANIEFKLELETQQTYIIEEKEKLISELEETLQFEREEHEHIQQKFKNEIEELHHKYTKDIRRLKVTHALDVQNLKENYQAEINDLQNRMKQISNQTPSSGNGRKDVVIRQLNHKIEQLEELLESTRHEYSDDIQKLIEEHEQDLLETTQEIDQLQRENQILKTRIKRIEQNQNEQNIIDSAGPHPYPTISSSSSSLSTNKPIQHPIYDKSTHHRKGSMVISEDPHGNRQILFIREQSPKKNTKSLPFGIDGDDLESSNCKYENGISDMEDKYCKQIKMLENDILKEKEEREFEQERILEQKQRLEFEISQLHKRTETLTEEMKEKEHENLNTVKDQRKAMGRIKEFFDKELNKKENEIELLKNEIYELKEENEHLNDNIDYLETQLRRQQFDRDQFDDYQEMENIYNEEFDEYEQQIHQLLDEVQTLRGSLQSREQELNDVNYSLQTRDQQRENLQTQLGHARRRTLLLETKQKDLVEQLSTLRNDKVHLEAEIQNVRQKQQQRYAESHLSLPESVQQQFSPEKSQSPPPPPISIREFSPEKSQSPPPQFICGQESIYEFSSEKSQSPPPQSVCQFSPEKSPPPAPLDDDLEAIRQRLTIEISNELTLRWEELLRLERIEKGVHKERAQQKEKELIVTEYEMKQVKQELMLTVRQQQTIVQEYTDQLENVQNQLIITKQQLTETVQSKLLLIANFNQELNRMRDQIRKRQHLDKKR